MTVSRLYYECHVTIEPVFDAKLALADIIAKKHHFKLADLLMQKRKEDTPERSRHDTFMTGHHKEYEVLFDRMVALIKDLKANGFQVWRAKVEDTLFDTKHGDLLPDNL